MKVYQMIYTSVKHSLADADLGLVNQAGQRVYSCSQGLTRENISELMRFSGYRLPKNNTVKYSKDFGDPEIPNLFPKTFRTLRLSDGKFAAVQSVYAGCDVNGDHGNFFAHALVFEEYPEDFFPEQYFESELFRTYLTKEEQNCELVKYMPVLENPQKSAAAERKIHEFINEHRKELTYLINHAVTMLTSENLRNICICTKDSKLTEQYLVALKWLLPRDISRNTGISTYNVYLPSDKQDRIVFHGTVAGKNNITREIVEARENCIYIDFENIDFSAVAESSLFNMSVEKIRDEYRKYNLSSVSSYLDWFSLTQNITYSGMGGKLLKFKNSAGDRSFAERARELFESIDDDAMRDVKFEITKVMYDNIDLFPEEAERLTEIYVSDCIDKLCRGENYDIDAVFYSAKVTEGQIGTMVKNLPAYLDKVYNSFEEMGEKNRYIFMNFISQLKHLAGFESWMEMMNGKKKYISILIELATPVIVTGFGVNTFSVPKDWTEDELHELIAYIEASTEDKQLSMGCIKYITEYNSVDWEKFGITLVKSKKMQYEIEEDSAKIHRWLSKVGYEPYQRNSYEILKREVMADIEESRSPLLVSRLLSAIYAWQGAYGDQREAQRLAEKIKVMLAELRKTQPQCYNYMIPKLALEILDSQGHYHELMINMETMPQSFWNWFLIGCLRCKRDDKKQLAYIRVYNAEKMKLNRLPIKSRLRKAFKDA